MIAFLSNMFGYLLNFLYNQVGNYGIAIILFSFIVKALMIPLSIHQQKTQKKSLKLQDEMKQIQFKYKNNPEKLNQETMALYKRENMSPFSGCLPAILQMVLLISVFLLVKEPLTYMKKCNLDEVNGYINVMIEENLVPNQAYAQIALISEVNNIKEIQSTENGELSDNQKKLKEKLGDNLNNICINMKFLNIDLSKVPTQSKGDNKVYIIPILYVLSSFISIKLTTSMQNKKKENGKIEIKDENIEGENTENNETKALVKKEEEDPMLQASKNMTMLMPIMAVSVSLIAPLGLALYWLTNNILMIIERLILNKVIHDEEE